MAYTVDYQQNSVTMDTKLRDDPDAYLDSLLNDLLSNPPQSPCHDQRPDHSISSILGSPKPKNSHDMVTELQSLLQPKPLPKNPPIQLPKPVLPKPLAKNPSIQLRSVMTRETELHRQLRLLQLQSPIEVQHLSSYYRFHSALVETSRYQSFFTCHPSSHGYLNSYYDNQLHQLIDKVEVCITCKV